MPGTKSAGFPSAPKSVRVSNTKPSKRCDQTDGTGDKEYEEGPVQFCSMDGCYNYRNLKECGRCKSARYCSVECQRKNWKQHKPACEFNATQLARVSEPPLLERYLRNWTVRFDATLTCACIRGLNLKFEWERIGQGGLLIFLEPRRHHNIGSRWRIQKAGVFPNEFIEEMIGKLDKGILKQYREHVLPMHMTERRRLQESSGGTADFASVFLIGMNMGSDALDGNHAPTFRFKPVDVHRVMVEHMPLASYEVDWLQELMDQVHDDHPTKHVVPK
ncbi:hypothetical protein MSAN_00114000 [Mycena sanguinolenta]|uniref:MYND-type domain-containing protein n=1 Tax=Mycena sanguinolenta TaxID=230812 RepID=A0A8H7DKQ1_9AGAR|nr:hypothetical protein MSAN_00114000 [Mycena sanguinolenta]